MHKLGHETPKGLLNYKCVFCTWYSKKKSSIERHMSLHTSRPEEYMSQVERNLITPAMLLEPVATKPRPAFSALSNLPMTPLSAPNFGTFPLFGTSSLSPLDLASATSLLSAAALYSPLTAPTTPQMPDFSALSSVRKNPIIDFESANPINF